MPGDFSVIRYAGCIDRISTNTVTKIVAATNIESKIDLPAGGSSTDETLYASD